MTMHFRGLSSVRDVRDGQYETESLVRIRTIVVARTAAGLTDLTTYHIEVGSQALTRYTTLISS